MQRYDFLITKYGIVLIFLPFSTHCKNTLDVKIIGKRGQKIYKLLFVDNLHIAKKVEKIFSFFDGAFKKISIFAMFIEGKMG